MFVVADCGEIRKDDRSDTFSGKNIKITIMGKFEDDRARVIDLLYRGYCYYKPQGSKKNVKVKIYYEELQSYDMDYDLFCEILSILEKEKVVKIIRQYECDDGSFILDYGNAPREETPSVADIECGKDFEEVYKSLLNELRGTIVNTAMSNTTEDTQLIPIPIPLGTTWEDIEIQFDDMYTISIRAMDQFMGRKTYVNLGFIRSGTKDKVPSRLWEFLRMLAILLEYPNSSKESIESCLMESLSTTSKGCEKTKSDVSKALRKLFTLKGKPFIKGKYQPKFRLLPVSIFKDNGEIIYQRGKSNDGESVMEGHDEEMREPRSRKINTRNSDFDD